MLSKITNANLLIPVGPYLLGLYIMYQISETIINVPSSFSSL